MTQLRAIVFDLDGTLIDSAPDVAAALNRMLAEEGRRQLTLQEVQGLVGEGARVLIEGAFTATGTAAAADQAERALARYLACYAEEPANRTIVFPGVRQTLAALAERGVPMGICTNKPIGMTRLVLDELGMAPLFAAVTGGDSLPFRKPDGRHILETLALMGSGPAGAVYVGDSRTDVAAARDAGLPVVAVSWGYAGGAPRALGADALVDDFSALPAVIYGLMKGGRA